MLTTLRRSLFRMSKLPQVIYNFPPHPLLRFPVSVVKGKQISLDSQETFELIITKLKSLHDYSTELQSEINSEDVKIDYTKKAQSKEEMRKEITRLAPIISLYNQIVVLQSNLKDLKEMMAETNQKADRLIIEKEMQALEAKKKEYKSEAIDLLIPAETYDDVNEVTMELKPGAGGQQASHFVEDISGMYINYCNSQGWRTTIISMQKEAGSRGYKHFNLKIYGEGVHKILKNQAGVHKVIRVPETQSKGRIHSSTVSMVLMPTIPFNFSVDPKDIKYQFTRSSGPGGQAVNKVESACRAIHIPTGLAVFIQEQRVQDANKKRATQILKQKLFEIEYQKSIDKAKQTRSSQVTSMDRSDKIRTYNYPQDRITDHRTGLTLFGIKEMLNGGYLQTFIDTYIEKSNQEKVKILIQELYEELK